MALMRLDVQGWNSLALDGAPLARELEFAAWAVLEKHIGAARVRGIREIGLFWICSGEKTARPSRLLGVRFLPRNKVKCRLMVAPKARMLAARNREYLRDVERLTLEVLAAIEARIDGCDLSRTAKAISRDLARLGTRFGRKRR
jgi:hypothetical protein